MLSIIFMMLVIVSGCIMGFGIGMLCAVLAEEGVEMELVKLDYDE